MKKTAKIEVRVPEGEKQAFIERCRARGETVSDAIRNLMRKYPGTHSRKLAIVSALGTLTSVAMISVLAVNSGPAEAKQYSALKGVFAYFDTNADDEISFTEFRATYDDAVSDDFVRQRFQAQDLDSSGDITMSEFIDVLINKARQDFNGLDRDQNSRLDLDEVTPREEDRRIKNAHQAILAWSGSINGSEFRRGRTVEDARSWDIFMWYWGEEGTIPEEYLTRVGQMFREYDEDNDGWITEEEYIAHASR